MDEIPATDDGCNLPAVVVKYKAAILAHRPAIFGDELHFRCSLAAMRDHATAMLRTAGPHATDILQAVVRFVTLILFERMPLDELSTKRLVTYQLVKCARDMRA